jgi:hypothetical protein
VGVIAEAARVRDAGRDDHPAGLGGHRGGRIALAAWPSLATSVRMHLADVVAVANVVRQLSSALASWQRWSTEPRSLRGGHDSGSLRRRGVRSTEKLEVRTRPDAIARATAFGLLVQTQSPG